LRAYDRAQSERSRQPRTRLWNPDNGKIVKLDCCRAESLPEKLKVSGCDGRSRRSLVIENLGRADPQIPGIISGRFRRRVWRGVGKGGARVVYDKEDVIAARESRRWVGEDVDIAKHVASSGVEIDTKTAMKASAGFRPVRRSETGPRIKNKLRRRSDAGTNDVNGELIYAPTGSR